MHKLYWGYWDRGDWPQPHSILLVSPLQYTADFQKRLGDFTARLGEVRLLRSEGRQDLETFARSGVDEVDYGRFQEEVRGCSRAAGLPVAGLASRVGFQAAAYPIFPQMKNPVVQTSLPALARSLEGLQKMQVSSRAGSGGCPCARGDVLTPLSPRRGMARWRGGWLPRPRPCGRCKTPRCNHRRLWW